ncbi:MAG: hypothetical protein ABSH03_23685, partial [Candidatus Lustribacter sp.]
LFRLLTAALNHRYPVPLTAWLDAGAADAVTGLLLKEQLDRDIRTSIERAAALAGEVLHYGGVDLGDAFKYELTEAILDSGLHVFDESRVMS